MLSNLSETLHSQRKSKNKHVAKILSLLLKRQKFGTTMQSPEDLENTPFKHLSKLFPVQSLRK